MSTVAILLNCGTIVSFSCSTIISFLVLLLIIYRFCYNCRSRQHVDCRYPNSPFEDNVCLLLIGNTYLIIFLYSITWISLLLRTFFGDFNLVTDRFDLGDSDLCRIQVGIIFFLTSAMYHSFLIQAVSRFFNIVQSSRFHPIQIGSMPVNGITIHLLMIIFSWILSFLILIPAYTSFHVFSYIPEQYHCLISFTNIRGFIYALFSCYLAPMFPIACLYMKVTNHISRLPKQGILLQTLREMTVKRQALKLCALVGCLGLPTLFFLLQFILTQKVHTMTDRLHAFCLAVNSVIFTLGYAALNSLGDLLPNVPAIHGRNTRTHSRGSSG